MTREGFDAYPQDCEQYPTTAGVQAGRQEVDEAIRRIALNIPPPAMNQIGPVTISCVVYKAATGKDYYDTAYANEVARIICKNLSNTVCPAGFMFAKKRKYSPTELAFPPSFESGMREVT